LKKDVDTPQKKVIVDRGMNDKNRKSEFWPPAGTPLRSTALVVHTSRWGLVFAPEKNNG